MRFRKFIPPMSIILFAVLPGLGCRAKSVPAPQPPALVAGHGRAGSVIVTHTPETQLRRDFYDDEHLPDFAHPTDEEKVAAKGLTLLKEGRIDEARAVYGRQWEFERDLRALAKEAGEKGRFAPALDLYRMLIAAREPLLWSQVAINSWLTEDAEYLACIEKAPAEVLDDAASQDLASRELFGRLKGLLDERDFDKPEFRRQCYEIADAYLAKFPKARLGIEAVLAACTAAEQEKPAEGEAPSAPGIRKADELLAKMRAAGAPRYALDAVLTNLMCRTGDFPDDRELLVRAREACEEIARESDPGRRAEWLIAAADHSLQAREENGLAARKLYEEVLGISPGPPWGLRALDGIVRTHTEIEGPDAGLAALRELEKASPPDADFVLALSNLADACKEAERPDQAVALLDEIVQRSRRSATKGRAFRQIAGIHKDAGDEAKMLAALERAAELLPPDQPLDPWWDACQRSFVYEELADYHVARKNWAEALKWSKAWKVQTGCANCDDSDRRTRRGYIALAEAALGRADDALKSMERVQDGPLAKAATMLVDTFRARGTLDELLPKLNAAAKSDKPVGAGIALCYVDLLRLADAKDVAGLWKALDLKDVPYDESEWLKKEVPLLAGGIGESAKPFLFERLAKGPHEDEALYALAQMKALEALPILMERAKDPHRTYDLDRTLRALASFDTDEVWSLIEKCADSDDYQRRGPAQSVLREHPRKR